MCGALDCVACYGEAARFCGWCEECQYAEEGECDPEEICPPAATLAGSSPTSTIRESTSGRIADSNATSRNDKTVSTGCETSDRRVKA
jgi:hypothetical protein